jgi:biopolymer transport protein ExbD
MNKFTKAIAAIMLMMVVAVGCNNPKTSKNTENNNGFYDSILGLPCGTYTLELPETDAFEFEERSFPTKDVYLVRPKSQTGQSRWIVVNGEITDMTSFKEVMEEWKSAFSKSDIPLLICRLNVDKSLKMSDVDEIMQILADIKIYRIQYAVIPKNPEIDIRDYPFVSLHPDRIQTRFWSDSLHQKRLESVQEIPNQIVVMPKGAEIYEINGITTKGEECKFILKQLMQQDSDYVIRFKVDNDMLYGDYMVIVTSAMEALDELKDEYAMEKYSKHWDQLYEYEEQIDIRDHFPFRFFEEK